MRNARPLVQCLILLLLATPLVLAEDEGPPRGGRRGGGSPWERLKGLDADGDGRISRAELRGRERVLERFDADGDGFVTQAEAEAASSRRGRDRTGSGTTAVPGVTRELVDADRDGQVSRAEWLAFFAATDADEDGRLSPEEWTKMLTARTRPGGKAPAIGSKAPAVRAVPLTGGEAVDLAAPKRTTVLIFGSWT